MESVLIRYTPVKRPQNTLLVFLTPICCAATTPSIAKCNDAIAVFATVNRVFFALSRYICAAGTVSGCPSGMTKAVGNLLAIDLASG
jgi:hypothetical protein